MFSLTISNDIVGIIKQSNDLLNNKLDITYINKLLQDRWLITDLIMQCIKWNNNEFVKLINWLLNINASNKCFANSTFFLMLTYNFTKKNGSIDKYNMISEYFVKNNIFFENNDLVKCKNVFLMVMRFFLSKIDKSEYGN